MTDTKLNPATLSAEERAFVDLLAAQRRRDGFPDDKCHEYAFEDARCMILARRALFAPATEKAVCPNCGEEATYPHGFKWDGEDHYRCSKPAQPEPAAPEKVAVRADFGYTPTGAPRKIVCRKCGKLTSELHEFNFYPMGCYFTCKVEPAQPEPAAPDVFATDRAIGALAMNAEDAPAAPEMPEAVRSALLGLRLPVNEGVQFTPKEMNRRADALESWWRNSAQPVIGELDRLGAQIETAKLLLCNSEDREAILGELLKALTTLATVRQQAAQPPRLEKVRELIEECRSIASSYLRDKAYAALAELDAHEKGEGRG